MPKRKLTSLLYDVIDIDATTLINDSADVNKQDKYGKTHLRRAALLNDIEGMELLINNGADVNQPYDCGKTPLHEATWTANITAMTLLINNGADVNKQDNYSRTPRYEATYKNNIDCIALLEKEAANPRRQCKECKKWLPGSMIRNNQCHPCFWSHARLLFISKREGGTFSDFPNEILKEVIKYI